MKIIHQSTIRVKSEPLFEAIRERFGRDWEDLAVELLGPPAKREKGGQEWRYLCPFHSETTPSFSFNIQKGTFYCFGCGARGDAIDLWAKLQGRDLKEAALEISQVFGIAIEEDGREARLPPRLTLSVYAQVKRLSLDLLKGWGLRDGKDGLEIPYFDEQGNEVAVRIRTAMVGENRFRWRPGDKPVLYGLWRLKDFSHDRLYLVEGESDSHTFWQVGLAALGLPGKTTWKSEWAKPLHAFSEIVIIEEPGARADVLKIARTLWRRGRGNVPEVFSLRLAAKDPSELWRRDPDPERFKAALEEADRELLDFAISKIKAEWLCLNQPQIRYRAKSFHIPYPYYQARGGLVRLEPTKTELRQTEVAPRPIILSGRYWDEKGQLWTEVSWQEPGGERWSSRLIERREALDKKTISDLIRWGAPVSSENASAVVRFLASFEERNLQLLEPSRASTKMGWVRTGANPVFLLGERAYGGEARFIPLGEEEERLCEAYKPKGQKESWVRLFAELEACSPPSSHLAKFIIAAGFAALLVRLLEERSGLVYVFGESGVGKTALLKLLLSAFGNPEELIGTAFSTAVGLERRAALFSDLPMAVDERQAATSEQFINQAIYMLSSGQAKGRGLKEGGLQAVTHWRSIILMTGEQDLTGSPWTGVENRTLQIYLPISLPEEFSRRLHKETAQNYGHIGPLFIEKLIQESQAGLQERRRTLEEALKAGVGGGEISGAHQVLLTVVGVADWLLLEVLGQGREEARAKALETIGEVQRGLAQKPRETMAEKAHDFILSKFAEFQADLRARVGKAQDERAFIEEDFLYILPTLFEDWLKDGGLTKKRVLEDWDSKGWIETSQEGGKRRYTVLKRSPELWAKRSRYYCLRLSVMEGRSENVTTFGEERDA